MILKRAHVRNFRCIEDSGWFGIDPITALVGKNESGKTAILQALERLKPTNKGRGGAGFLNSGSAYDKWMVLQS
ncbi:MAG: AAA family ATPase [Candidatus Baltobacteraceae bacterium]